MIKTSITYHTLEHKSTFYRAASVTPMLCMLRVSLSLLTGALVWLVLMKMVDGVGVSHPTRGIARGTDDASCSNTATKMRK